VRDDRWQRVIEDLKREGLIGGAGISVNRWEPENGLETLRTGLIDAVQVIYNIFDQAPEDALFPLCRELGIAVIDAGHYGTEKYFAENFAAQLRDLAGEELDVLESALNIDPFIV
jgi:aryl-alcohol dehydrogenase-like predicted oxidoreductase